MHLALQVINPPYSYQDMDTAIKLAQAAVEKGHKVSIFLFADSVLAVNTKVKPIKMDRNIADMLRGLAEKGVDIHICGLCFEYRGLNIEDAVPGSMLSGVPELASLLAHCDRFVSFAV
ncbi:sulfur reduction protein DsrE [Coprothermobacteraceae bacterium]|nr:sulfur reduction protein DsrE [Coprothermobacteraceae bacterium]